MKNTTNEQIRYVAFKLFLEKGYEATNIRDICKEVNIKASSLYFYYSSKKELFFSLYEEIWHDKINYLKNIQELKQRFSPHLKFYHLFIRTMKYYSDNFANMKFLLRYHLFPPEEITDSIRERYQLWNDEEKKIVSDIVQECLADRIFTDKRLPDYYLREYRKYIDSLFTEMVLSNLKMSAKELELSWARFWNCLV